MGTQTCIYTFERSQKLMVATSIDRLLGTTLGKYGSCRCKSKSPRPSVFISLSTPSRLKSWREREREHMNTPIPCRILVRLKNTTPIRHITSTFLFKCNPQIVRSTSTRRNKVSSCMYILPTFPLRAPGHFLLVTTTTSYSKMRPTLGFEQFGPASHSQKVCLKE